MNEFSMHHYEHDFGFKFYEIITKNKVRFLKIIEQEDRLAYKWLIF